MIPLFEPKKIINRNILLRGHSPNISLEDIVKLKEFADICLKHGQINEINPSDSSMIVNLTKISKEDIITIHKTYGNEGLFKLQFLLSTTAKEEFNHFYDVITDELVFSKMLNYGEEIILDNKLIPQNNAVNDFNTNVVQPSFSRKIYNPGRHHGYLVYGIGGPRILVSHPFQGIDGNLEAYDIYNNTVDVVSSLILRGYYGTFMFLDYLPGLNYKINGIPAWVIWFSVIATHSDLVIYVKEYEEDFGYSQQMELEYTSNLVQKKIVEIQHSELKWAKMEEIKVDEILYVGKNGRMSQEEWYRMEAEHAMPFINNFVDLSFPKDRFIQINEDGSVKEFPLHFNFYQSE